MKKYYSTKEVCHLLKKSRTTLWRIEKRGELVSVKYHGKQKKWLATDVIRYKKGMNFKK